MGISPTMLLNKQIQPSAKHDALQFWICVLCLQEETPANFTLGIWFLGAILVPLFVFVPNFVLLATVIHKVKKNFGVSYNR